MRNQSIEELIRIASQALRKEIILKKGLASAKTKTIWRGGPNWILWSFLMGPRRIAILPKKMLFHRSRFSTDRASSRRRRED